jgi:Cu+-exporting ATPase
MNIFKNQVGNKIAKNPLLKLVPELKKHIYTCPMHPEVEQEQPGNCPKCGMTLEPRITSTGVKEEDNSDLRIMTKRFWFAALLTFPIFFLAMAHLIPQLSKQSWVGDDFSRNE